MSGLVFVLPVSGSAEEFPFPSEESGGEHGEISKGLYANSLDMLPPGQQKSSQESSSKLDVIKVPMIDQNRNSIGEVTLLPELKRNKGCLLNFLPGTSKSGKFV